MGKIKHTLSTMQLKMKKGVQANKSKLLVPLAALVLAVSAVTGVAAMANAAGTTTTTGTTSRQHTPPAAMGTVTAISGDSITLTDTKTNTTYTIDATNATITKRTAPTASTSGTTSTSSTGTSGKRTWTAPATITVSQISVGDTLVVQGTVSGTNITATKIMDGVGGLGGGRGGKGGPGGMGVMGTVTAVSGDTLTVTGKNGTTYTVDGSSATASKREAISVSDIAVGDTVGIQGTVSGDSVTAKSIMDGIPTPPAQTSSETTGS